MTISEETIQHMKVDEQVAYVLGLIQDDIDVEDQIMGQAYVDNFDAEAFIKKHGLVSISKEAVEAAHLDLQRIFEATATSEYNTDDV